MKKYINFSLAGIALIAAFSSCQKQLNLNPISSISNASYWKTSNQFDAFVTGVHAQFRQDNANMQTLGEMRADIFGTDLPNLSAFTGEATQGLERTWQNNLTLTATPVTNFGGFYYNINQINLLISKLQTTTVVPAANRQYYLGIAYGMRAFYYFHLLRSWGAVVIQTDPVLSFNIATLAKPASSAAQVTALIKTDIDSSLNNFGANYSFFTGFGKAYWSKAATEMLKANVYLWTSYRGGGAADATTALNALNDIQTNVPALKLITTNASVTGPVTGSGLLSPYASVFSSANKGNAEIIFASHYLYSASVNEATMSFVTNSFVPQTGLISNFYDSVNNVQFNGNTTGNWGGLLRAPVKIAAFRQFNPLDTRALASIQPAYTFSGGNYTIAGCFADKYQGEFVTGNRAIDNDFPIYRYADLLLLKAEAEIILGTDPSNEINMVRARAYGANYNAATMGFPNQPIDANPVEALLQERFYEFIFEGKRWYDLVRMDPAGSYVFEHTTATQAYQLLWPIDQTALTNNTQLTQNPGYASH
ncbi:MAG: SusD family outer membrane lipoprotein NanU [Bacteroidetes bacterium]|nr:SusD family outer membrane lipoprotein NanU [Bacteroidota bacterium]MBS1973675.1 SusD family outer membrane lipoprotein NanU [Bacteroidota bacterium]